MRKKLYSLIIVAIIILISTVFIAIAEKNSWSDAKVKQSIHKLSKTIGVRAAGKTNEHKAANYIEQHLKDMGYSPKRQKFRIAGNKTSYNIIAQKSGKSARKLILGAHYDSKSPSPGANDNGSGVASLLEIARISKTENPRYNLVFVFFGAEEKVGSNSDNHHYGSRHYVKTISSSAKENTAGMISVDMVGYGSSFHVRSMKRGTMSLVNSLLGHARKKGYKLTYLKDPGKTGWSDHEAFELAGIPAAWLEWRDDPTYHSAKDNFAHMQWKRITTTGNFLQSFVR